MKSRTPAAYSVQTLRQVAWPAKKGILPTPFAAVSPPPSRSVPNSSSSVNRRKKAASACSCDHDGSDSTLSDSGAIVGIALPNTASYCAATSLQDGHTARCSSSRFCSSAVSWPEVETAQSSMNSSWGDCDNAPAPDLRVTFYHIRYRPAILQEISASVACPTLDNNDCECCPQIDRALRQFRRRYNH